jgi:hypothetical protein
MRTVKVLAGAFGAALLASGRSSWSSGLSSVVSVFEMDDVLDGAVRTPVPVDGEETVPDSVSGVGGETFPEDRTSGAGPAFAAVMELAG